MGYNLLIMGVGCSVVFDITRQGALGGGNALGWLENQDHPVEPLVIIRFITTIYIALFLLT